MINKSRSSAQITTDTNSDDQGTKVPNIHTQNINSRKDKNAKQRFAKRQLKLNQLLTAEQSTGLLFLQASTLWRRNVELALHPHGITYVQFVLLEALSHLTRSGEQISQNDLAAFTKRDVTITSQVLRMLEKRNLVTRVTDQNDARTRKLAVTEAGVIVLETAMKIVDAADKQFFATLGNKQEAFTTCLQELITAEDAEK